MKKILLCLIAIVFVCCASSGEAAPAKGFAGLTSPEQIALPSHGIAPVTIELGNKKEAVTILSSDVWFGIAGGNQDIAAGSPKTVKLWFEPNFSSHARRGVITIKGVKSGSVKSVEVSQPPYFTTIEEGFPARLETQTFKSDNWVYGGICSPKDSPAVMSAVSTSGSPLSFSLSTGPCVSGTHAGDYFIYAVPTKHVASGEQIDFMCTIVGSQATSPKYFIFEYWDNGRWNSIKSELRTAEEDSSIKYSFYNKYFSSAHHTTYTQSFTLMQPIENDCVRVRLRILSEGAGVTKFSSGGRYMSMYMIKYSNAPAVTDRYKMLFVGNSFTYYYGTAFMFKEIARSQGHQVDAIISVKGSQEFSEHLQLERTLEAIGRGGFDYAFLQDTSPNPAKYADERRPEILEACKEINALTLSYSPNCQIIYERCWACPKDDFRGFGSYDKLDEMLKRGSEMLREELGGTVWVSPIGLGFRVGREQGLTMLHTDDQHQSRIGAYMKACINYLLVYQTRFTDTVSDCAVDAATAKIVRQIAERVVFEGVAEPY